MRIIISPAKKMREDPDSFAPEGLPPFLPEADRLKQQLQTMSYDQLKALWRCSDAITRQNVERLEGMYNTINLYRVNVSVIILLSLPDVLLLQITVQGIQDSSFIAAPKRSSQKTAGTVAGQTVYCDPGIEMRDTCAQKLNILHHPGDVKRMLFIFQGKIRSF